MNLTRLTRSIRQRSGPLTVQLRQESAPFDLGRVPSAIKPDAVVDSVCGYCSTGCGLRVHLRGGEAVNLTGAGDYPVNLGSACPKGWESLTPLSSSARATVPRVRNEQGHLVRVSWHDAMLEFAQRFQAIRDRHGPEALAWLGTGQITTEELAFLGALGKFGIGMRHGDGNTRQCMATSVAAYKESFGFDAPPYTYADFEASDVLVFVGSNLAIAHPILWQRVLRNKRQPEVIVVDPRRTETAMGATQHLGIAPKSDLALFYGVAHLLITNDWVDWEFVLAHTNGFDSYVRHVRRFTPDRVASDTGLTVGQIFRLAETIHLGNAVSFWWTMGVNQGHQATRTAQAIINLALLTGNIGKPGTGANSITGQCNAMGSRLFSNTTNLLGGHDFGNPAHRQKISEIAGIPVEKIPSENSWCYDQIVDGIDSGKIKGLWMVGTNSAHSWIHQSRCRSLLERLDCLVVQDMFGDTESVALADIALPAAGWGEKEGTFINSERRIGVIRKVSTPPGEALSDFNIFKLASHYFGCEELFRDWSSPEGVFQILKRCSVGQPCEFTGIRDYVHLEERGGIQWPFRESHDFGEGGQERRLFQDGRFFTADSRARFCHETVSPVPEPVDDDYPFILLTGRGSSAQWHTQTRTGKSAILRRLHPGSIYVEIHPSDADRLGIADTGKVMVHSRRGGLTATAFVVGTVQPGQLFIPMHYPETNLLTCPSFDPYSRQPSYKHCAVQIKAVPA